MSGTGFFSAIAALVKPNRRRYDRRPVYAPIHLHVGSDRFDCRISDVSASGALLTGAPSLPIGTLLVLEVPAVGMQADARVVRQSAQGMGVAFTKEGVGAIIAGWLRGQSPADPA
ncbi:MULTISPECIES: PilZ domain-containing protein [unclassified Azospirillum]|uniref:PilZ domain-containing protein n=1 Tax=unclassified Azospirillum TaxID=2630922 RepID=UPI000B676FB8|nr:MULTISPECIES: PilZ domain-containing protein [unclassified Azospirillum]SNS87251.1 PilZ domain-containing protein [Azospirillum sp. RU38E]SNT04178.1 PilZ domain-containing protein [Azospirillum sp. RU37A]